MKKILIGFLFFVLGATAAASGEIITLPAITKKFEATKFSLENAPSESIRGKITSMVGEIWWQSRTATEPARLTEAITIQQGEVLIASESGNLTVKFDPAATLTLFPETKVEIVQTLPLNLVFNQTKGIGQYQVSGTNPVTVRSFNLIVNIDNGLINIDTDEETRVITLSLKTGAAKVGYNSPEFDSKVWQLEPGDIFEYESNERRGYFKAP